MKRRVWQQGFLICFLVLFIALLYTTKVAQHVTRYKCADGSITNDPDFCQGTAVELVETPQTEAKPAEAQPEQLIVPGEIVREITPILREQAQEMALEQQPVQPASAQPTIHTGKVSLSLNPKYDPSVSEQGIAWVEYNEGDANIHYKDLKTGIITPVAASRNVEYSPLLSKGKIAYIKAVSAGDTANEIFLYNVKRNLTTRLICGETAKSLVDFDGELLIYKESMFDTNRVVDVRVLDGWNCKESRQVYLSKDENPLKILDRGLLNVQHMRSTSPYPCRALNLSNRDILNFSIPCVDATEHLAANETGYFFWDKPTTFFQIRSAERAESYTGYSSPTAFVRVSGDRIALQLPDIEINKLQFIRPEYDLVVYDLTATNALPFATTMKTKEETVAGITFTHDFDFDGNVLAWVDIRRDRNRPDIYVAVVS